MPQFCEYTGSMCMELRAPQCPDDETLNYCETHLAIVLRERASRRRAAAASRDLAVGGRRDGARHHSQRSRSEPYLGRSTIQWPCDRNGRLALMDDEFRSMYSKNNWFRSASTPARINAPAAVPMIQPSPSAAMQEAFLAMATTTPPQSHELRRKHGRGRKTVVTPRFEMLSGSSSPPDRWHVNFGDESEANSDPEHHAYTKVDVRLDDRVAVGGEQGVTGNFFC